MDYFEQVHEIIDPQKRRILYVNAEIAERILQFGFADTVPQHFVSIFTQPDSIYMDTRNGVHCYTKHMKGKMYNVSTMEIEEMGEKFFTINSWFEERDITQNTLKQFVKAADNEKLRKKMKAKIEDSQSWMKILYTDTSYFKAKKYLKKGIKVVSKRGKIVVEVPESIVKKK